MPKVYSDYILTNTTHSVLYVGMTNNLKVRVYSHKQRMGSNFTSKYHVNILVYYETHEDINLTIKKEKQLKNLVGRKKEELITQFNPTWEDLYNQI